MAENIYILTTHTKIAAGGDEATVLSRDQLDAVGALVKADAAEAITPIAEAFGFEVISTRTMWRATSAAEG